MHRANGAFSYTKSSLGGSWSRPFPPQGDVLLADNLHLKRNLGGAARLGSIGKMAPSRPMRGLLLLEILRVLDCDVKTRCFLESESVLAAKYLILVVAKGKVNDEINVALFV